jgi:hypothetical protein
MKIVNETQRKGRHAVLFMAENALDQALLAGFFAIVTRHRAVQATLEQSAGAKWQSLRLEEFD